MHSYLIVKRRQIWYTYLNEMKYKIAPYGDFLIRNWKVSPKLESLKIHTFLLEGSRKKATESSTFNFAERNLSLTERYGRHFLLF